MKKYVEPNLVKIAKEQDVFDILSRDGVAMTYKNGVYRHKLHDSLVITPKKGFYWFSRGFGSNNAIDYYTQVEGMNFADATYKVLDVMNYDYSRKNIVILQDNNSRGNYISQEFMLPEAAANNKNVYAYLVKTRGINKTIVEKLIQANLIYQSKDYNNAVFVGKDYDGNIVSAFKRTTRTNLSKDSWTKGDATGSQKDYRFRIENTNNTTVNVFEAEIDLLSYLSLQDERTRNENYVALGGVSDRAILKFLEHNSHIEKVNICTDNDAAGHKFAKELARKIGDKYHITREIPVNKDYNEDLLQGVEYKRERIDVITFSNDLDMMSRKEKIAYVNKIFQEKYQGKTVNMNYSTKVEFDSEAKINKYTRLSYRNQDKIETNNAYFNRLNLGIDGELLEHLKDSSYSFSKKEMKSEQNSRHATACAWHYFNKKMIIDGELYNMVVDVRESQTHETYIHKIRLEECEFLEEKEKGKFFTNTHKGISRREELPFNVTYNTTKVDISQENEIQENKNEFIEENDFEF